LPGCAHWLALADAVRELGKAASKLTPKLDSIRKGSGNRNGAEARDMFTTRLAANAAGFPKTDLKPRRCLMEAGEHVVT
jgi:hypothetical protein